ncbi:MAG TPA: lipid-A-disaccharide synthase N-terminal domain-containing protein [Tepidisphaeraceae bacterium]
MKRVTLLLFEVCLLIALGVWVYLSLSHSQPTTRPGGVVVSIQLPNANDKVVLYKSDDAQYRFSVQQDDGRHVDLSPEELAVRMHHDVAERPLAQRLLNVSNPWGYVWVTLGLLGQVLFTGRMIVQWLVSEKSKRSIVPPAFWWMSLAGSSMLMVYFLWRQDPIGLLGQTFGWFIYIRNLWMIYRPKSAPADLTADPASEPAVN